MPINTTIQLKTSSVANKTPQTSDLVLGELAINTANGIVFMEDTAGNIRKFDASTITPSLNGSAEITFGGAFTFQANVVAKDSSENIIVAGIVNNIYWGIIKISPTNQLIWARQLGISGGQNRPLGISVDVNDNIIICGDFYSPTVVYFGVVVKYNKNGVLQWQKSLSYSGLINTFHKCKTDSLGNIYVGGWANTASIGAIGHIASYNPQGTIRWQRYFDNNSGNAWQDAIDSLTIHEPTNSVYVNAFLAYGASNCNQILFRCNMSDGVGIWIKTFNNASSSTGTILGGVAVDSLGQPTMYFSNSNGASNVFTVAKFDVNGGVLWKRQMTFSASTIFYTLGLTIDSSDNLYLTGGDLSSKGLIACYNSSGVLQWQTQVLGTSLSLNDIVVNSANDIAVGTYTRGGIIKYDHDTARPYTINGLTYSTSSFSEVASSLTVSTPTWVFAPAAATDATASGTDSALTVTISIYS